MDLTELIEALGIKDDHWCGASIPPDWGVILIPLMQHLADHDVTIIQVKAKFGGLRVYLRGGNSITEHLISLAERQVWAMRHIDPLAEAIEEAKEQSE